MKVGTSWTKAIFPSPVMAAPAKPSVPCKSEPSGLITTSSRPIRWFTTKPNFFIFVRLSTNNQFFYTLNKASSITISSAIALYLKWIYSFVSLIGIQQEGLIYILAKNLYFSSKKRIIYDHLHPVTYGCIHLYQYQALLLSHYLWHLCLLVNIN